MTLMLLSLLIAVTPLIPQSAPIATATDRVRDPDRDPLPGDPQRGDAIRRGYRIFLDTPHNAPRYTKSALSCGSCHLNAGQKEGAMPLVGIAKVFPEYNRRSGRTFTLEDRVIGCFLRSLNAPGLTGGGPDEHENGSPHPTRDDGEVKDLVAYLEWISEGVAAEETRTWRGIAIARDKLVPLAKLDLARGRKLYVAKCLQCHGRNGQGVQVGDLKAGPLWGPRSWNDGAGAARTYTLAGYLRHAMPYLAPGSLTDEEAQQIAAYIDSKPRPVFEAKSRDFLVEPLPPDAVYYRR
jgi:thiosulfate dehydrogenase